MNQYSDLERLARVVVRVRDLYREDPDMYVEILHAAIDTLENAVIVSELDRQYEIPLPEFEQGQAVDLAFCRPREEKS